MDPLKIRTREGPEGVIQDAIIKMLTYKGWFVKPTHGNMYQSGFPDLFCTHPDYRMRWVEVKNPISYCFTPAQLKIFPLLSSHGSPIWILTAATEDEYKKLWCPENWYVYRNLQNPRAGC